MSELTIEDARRYIAEHRDELTRSLQESTEVHSAMKSMPFVQQLWDAGCWLGEVLEQHGATEEENEAICFAHGQRCFGRDPLGEAVRLANEFIATGTTKDRPGPALAEEILDETVRVKDD